MSKTAEPRPAPLDADAIPGVAAPRATAAACALEGARLFGHDAAEAEIRASFREGRAHHAWMLRGPRGVGKATLALRLAAWILSLDDAEPLQSAARNLAAGAHPRAFELSRGWNEKTKRFRGNISVDDARRLGRFFELTAADGGWRVALIDAADDFNKEAANALLKAIEEPPARAAVFIVAHGEVPPPPTIGSRCRKVALGGLGVADALAALEQAAEGRLDRDAAERLAPLAAVGGGGGAVSPGALARLLAADGEAVYAELMALLAPLPRLDGARLDKLMGSVSRQAGAEKYAAVVKLLPLAFERLARSAALGARDALRVDEIKVASRLATGLGAARVWARRASEARAAFSEAQELNLDPARTLLDIFMRIEEEGGGAPRP